MMKIKKLCITGFIFLTSVFLSLSAWSVPGQISYQGQITDQGGTPLDGTFNMRFSLYVTKTSGTPLWQEEQNVVVNDGIYNVQLGSVYPLISDDFEGDEVYLEIGLLNTDTSTWEILSPRQKLTSTAYAFQAENALTLEGSGSSEFASAVHDHSGNEITSGTVDESRIDSDIARDSEITWGNLADIPACFADGLDNIGLTSSSDYGRSGVASNLYEGSNSLTSKYLNDDRAETIKAKTYNDLLSVIQDGTGKAINAQSEGTIGLRGESKGEDGAGVAGYNFTKTGSGIFGQGGSKGVRGYSNQPSAVGIYGEAAGSKGKAVYGYASNSGDVTNYGGYFLANGKNGQGGHFEAKGQYSRAVHAENNYSGSEVYAALATSGTGVIGYHSMGNYGWVGTSNYGLYGKNGNANGYGVYGYANGSGGTGVFARASASNGVGLYARGGTSGWAADFIGKVRIRNNNLIPVMELGEGLDYAEGFDLTEKAGAEPGSVLVIDSDNPGKLTVSTQAYDTRVAGIVAGAKSLGSGVRLGVGKFDRDVALAGRVYCNVIAAEKSVQPGDLLTTSDIPGFAMKASDSFRANGAILGKAMETLEMRTKGQILVLVTLQ